MWPYIAIGIAFCLGVGFLASMATQMSVNTWYKALAKPFFTPPNWLFAPVWSLLYVLMGVSVGRVMYYGLHHLWGKTALYHFGFQLLFNGLWSMVFFGLRKPILALLIILILLALIERTIKWFRTVDKLSAQILYPYFLWVIYATLLNVGIVFLNFL